MTRPVTSVVLDVDPRASRTIPSPVRDETFHIALLGEFSGRREAGSAPVADLEPRAVDRDDLDAVLQRLAPATRMGGAGSDESLEITFGSMDDFHPDRLLERLPLFRSIRDMVEGMGASRRPDGPDEPAPLPPVEKLLEGGVLDRIVAGQEEGAPDDRDPLAAWVDALVTPHLAREPGQVERAMTDQVEAMTAEGMRAVLVDPGFRALESLWRGVEFLVRRIETDARLRLWLVDLSQEELLADVNGEEGGASRFRDLLVRGAGPEGEPWSVVAATWSFGPDPRELVALRGVARSCAASGAIFLGGGASGLAGAPTLTDTLDRAAQAEPPRLWEAFRREPEARSMGLLTPGLMLRVPYGADGVPCERLDFEEIDTDAGPEAYLWGSPVLPALVLLANAFRNAGGGDLWNAVGLEVGDLPLHLQRVEGRTAALPCTEVALTRYAAERLLDAGLMPLEWLSGSDRIRILRFQSVASPPAGLALRGG